MSLRWLERPHLTLLSASQALNSLSLHRACVYPDSLTECTLVFNHHLLVHINQILHRYPLYLFWYKHTTFLAQLSRAGGRMSTTTSFLALRVPWSFSFRAYDQAGLHYCNTQPIPSCHMVDFPLGIRRKIEKTDPYAAGCSGCVWTGSLIHVRKKQYSYFIDLVLLVLEKERIQAEKLATEIARTIK